MNPTKNVLWRKYTLGSYGNFPLYSEASFVLPRPCRLAGWQAGGWGEVTKKARVECASYHLLRDLPLPFPPPPPLLGNRRKREGILRRVHDSRLQQIAACDLDDYVTNSVAAFFFSLNSSNSTLWSNESCWLLNFTLYFYFSCGLLECV